MIAVHRHHIALNHRVDQLAEISDPGIVIAGLPELRSTGLLIGSILQDLRDIALVQTAFSREKLESVPVVRQMAGSHHDARIACKLRKHRCHEHRRRRCESAVVHLYTIRSEAVHHSLHQALSRNSRITSDRNGQILRLFP